MNVLVCMCVCAHAEAEADVSPAQSVFYLAHRSRPPSKTPTWGVLVASSQGWYHRGVTKPTCMAYMDSESLSSGPLACTTSTLTELFLQPSFSLLKIIFLAFFLSKISSLQALSFGIKSLAQYPFIPCKVQVCLP